MGIKRKLFGKYLLITNTLSCGLMMGAADVIQQYREQFKRSYYNSERFRRTGINTVMAASLDSERIESTISSVDNENPKSSNYRHDFVRTKNMMTVGFLQGPFHHCFYKILEQIFPGKTASAIIKKTLLDQSIASPTCLAIFFVGLGLLEGRSLKDIREELKLKLRETWKIDCCFWPPTQFVNFRFIPLQYRVLYINFMTMIYDIFLSYMKYDAEFE